MHHVSEINRKIGRVEDWKGGRMEGWKIGRVEGWKIGRMEGWKGGRVEGWKDGRVEGWKIERVEVKGASCFGNKYALYACRTAGVGLCQILIQTSNQNFTHPFFTLTHRLSIAKIGDTA